MRASLRADSPALRDESARPWRLEPQQSITEMLKSVKLRVEEIFTATQKKDKQALKEEEVAWQQRMEHTARLRTLRLAKGAADKEKEDDG